MLRLRTLGALDLRREDDKAVQSVLAQPRRAALLVYLTLGRSGPCHRRDILLPLFWPEHDSASGRHALSQALYRLRQSLGADVWAACAGDEVGLAGDRIWCDATAFEDAAARRRWADAIDLYRGDFLAGFHAGDAPGFEDWVELERSRLRDLAAGAGWELAREQLARGAHVEAERTAERALELDATREATARAFVAELAHAAGPSLALRLGRRLLSILREDLGVEPESATLQAIEQLARRPEIAVADVPDPVVNRVTGESESDRPDEAVPKPATARRLRQWRASVAAALALGLGAVLALVALRDPPAAVDADRVLVLPFEVITSDTSAAYLGDAVVVLLSTRLGAAASAVDAEVVLRELERRQRAGETAGLDESLRFARDLAAGRLLTGAIVVQGGHLTLNGALHDSRTGAVLATGTTSGPSDSLASVADRLAASLLSLEAGERRERLEDLVTRSPEALRAYLEGAAAFRAGRYEAAVPALQHALAQDTSFVLAALVLAQASSFGANVDWAEEARVDDLLERKRHLLNPRDRALADVNVGAAYPGSRTNLQRWQARSRLVRIAPDMPEAWFWLGDALFHWGSGLRTTDNPGLAREAFRRALEIDSTFAPALHHLAELEFYAGDAHASRGYAQAFLRTEDQGSTSSLMRWLIGVADGDSTGRERLIRSLTQERIFAALGIARWSQRMPSLGRDAHLATERLLADPRSGQAAVARLVAFDYFLNAGRPEDAFRQLAEASEMPPHERAGLLLLAALYGGGGLEGAVDAASVLERSVVAGPTVEVRLDAQCWLAHLHLRRNDEAALDVAREWLARWQPDSSAEQRRPVRFQGRVELCSAIADAALATVRSTGDAKSRVDRLDSLVVDLGLSDGIGPDPGRSRRETWAIQLMVGDMYVRAGAHDRALEVVRREIVSTDAFLLSARLLTQADLLEQLGQESEALRLREHVAGLHREQARRGEQSASSRD